MKCKRPIYLLFLILFLYNTDGLLAQNLDTISQQQFESHNDELGFDKTKKELNLKEFNFDLGPNELGYFDFLSNLFSVLGYLFLAILVMFLIYIIIRDTRFNKKVKNSDIDLDNIEDIKSIDFDKMLAETLLAKDYRLAIRIKFLMVIKSLTEQEIIDWKPYKTNRTYAKELNKTAFKPEFLRLTNVFEHIWYGISSIEEEQYLQYDPYFDSFLNQIKG